MYSQMDEKPLNIGEYLSYKMYENGFMYVFGVQGIISSISRWFWQEGGYQGREVQIFRSGLITVLIWEITGKIYFIMFMLWYSWNLSPGQRS